MEPAGRLARGHLLISRKYLWISRIFSQNPVYNDVRVKWPLNFNRVGYVKALECIMGSLEFHRCNWSSPLVILVSFGHPSVDKVTLFRQKGQKARFLLSFYTGFWLTLRETDKYLREINKCPRANLPAGSIHIASSASDVDFKCPSDPHGSFPPACSWASLLRRR